jgi:hypothetical protein
LHGKGLKTMETKARRLKTMESFPLSHWLMVALLAITISALLKRFAK